MIKQLCGTAVLICGLAGASSGAILVPEGGLTGTRSLGSGLSGVYDVTLDYSVTIEGDFLRYTYDFRVNADNSDRRRPAISNLHLELTPGCGTTDADCIIQNIEITSGQLFFGTFTNHVPSSLTGLKVDNINNELDFTLTFLSNRLPMWGDVGGKGSTRTFYNTGFGTAPGDPNSPDDATHQSWILVPDSENFSGGDPGGEEPGIPEPASMALLGGGLLVLGVARRYRRL